MFLLFFSLSGWPYISLAGPVRRRGRAFSFFFIRMHHVMSITDHPIRSGHHVLYYIYTYFLPPTFSISSRERRIFAFGKRERKKERKKEMITNRLCVAGHHKGFFFPQ